MSNDATAVVLSICGIAAVVGVLILLAGFLLLRVFRMSIFGLGIHAMRIFTEPKEEPGGFDPQAEAALRSRPRNLRAQAQAVDFDAAVARQTGSTQTNQAVRPDPNAISAQSAPPADNNSTATGEDRPLRRRQFRRDENMDDLLGGFEEE